MSVVLALTLIVRHPETGAAVALIAGQPLPDWAEGLVHPDDLVEPEPVTDPAAAEVEVVAVPADGAPEDATPAQIVPGDDGIPVLQPVTEPVEPEPVTDPAPAKRTRARK